MTRRLHWFNQASVRSPSLRSYPPEPAQLLAALHTLTSNPRSNASFCERSSTSFKVISLVSMQLVGPLLATSAQEPGLLDRLDSIRYISERVGVVNVGRSTD